MPAKRKHILCFSIVMVHSVVPGLCSEAVLSAATAPLPICIKTEVAPNLVSARAAQLAKIIGIESEILQLSAGSAGDESAHLSMRLIRKILRTLLEAETVLSKIDSEVADADEEREKLEARRDHAVTMNDIANFMSTGALSSAGASTQIANNAAGNLVQAAGGITSMALSTRSLFKERGPRPRVSYARPNMLAKSLGYEAPPSEDYPKAVWTYLNTAEPDKAGSRLSVLMDRWTAEGNFIGNKQQRMAMLSGIARNYQVTIELLDTRRDMLTELRAEVGKIHQDLLELLSAIE